MPWLRLNALATLADVVDVAAVTHMAVDATLTITVGAALTVAVAAVLRQKQKQRLNLRVSQIATTRFARSRLLIQLKTSVQT